MPAVFNSDTTIQLDPISITIYDQFDELDVPYLDSINSIIIDNSSIDLSVFNELPFIISNFQIEFLNDKNKC